MSEKNSKALVPIKKVLPPAINEKAKNYTEPFQLVNKSVRLSQEKK